MARAVPYAWLQLSHEKLRLVAAVGGITFAVVLVFMQLGLRAALFDSSVRLHGGMDYDLVMLSPRTTFLAQTKSFPRNRLYQVAGLDSVASVSPLYVFLARYYYQGTPDTHRKVLAIGIDPADDNIRLRGVQEHLSALRVPDTVIMDRYSRTEFAPAIADVARNEAVKLQVNERTVSLIGLFELGTSFGIDGSLITTDLNFQRMFPDRGPGQIDLGLIRLAKGADPTAVKDTIAAFLPDDVLVLTQAEYVAREVAYWNGSTPIGYVFTLGAVIGVLVGLIIVYQILFADVQNHLAEYATLKAMGYTNGFLNGLVFREAFILSVLGYIPAVGLTVLLYSQAEQATQLPLAMTLERAGVVFVATVAMCCASGLLAIRRLGKVDPAEVF
ncbi:MAG: FtsX-like permease family protein [Gammaproteobacteria bacterium]|nr:FtsX-like permease family protein [Gammaproteobacteria bacterium]